MSEQEFRRALGYANSAMDLLKRGQTYPFVLETRRGERLEVRDWNEPSAWKKA